MEHVLGRALPKLADFEASLSSGVSLCLLGKKCAPELNAVWSDIYDSDEEQFKVGVCVRACGGEGRSGGEPNQLCSLLAVFLVFLVYCCAVMCVSHCVSLSHHYRGMVQTRAMVGTLDSMPLSWRGLDYQR